MVELVSHKRDHKISDELFFGGNKSFLYLKFSILLLNHQVSSELNNRISTKYLTVSYLRSSCYQLEPFYLNTGSDLESHEDVPGRESTNIILEICQSFILLNKGNNSLWNLDSRRWTELATCRLLVSFKRRPGTTKSLHDEGVVFPLV